MTLLHNKIDLVSWLDAFTCFMPEVTKKANEPAKMHRRSEAMRTSMSVKPLLNSYPPPR